MNFENLKFQTIETKNRRTTTQEEHVGRRQRENFFNTYKRIVALRGCQRTIFVFSISAHDVQLSKFAFNRTNPMLSGLVLQ